MSTDGDLDEIAPFIQLFANGLHPAIKLLMVATVFGSILIPVLICLFYFSTPATRKRPIFISIVVSICLGLLEAVWIAHVVISILYHPLQPRNASIVISVGLINFLPTIAVDVVLLFRMIAVYPYSATPKLQFAAIFTLPVVLKIMRIVAWIIFSTSVSGQLQGYSFDMNHKQQSWSIAIWVMTAVDNAYASAIFIWKLRGSFKSADSGRMSPVSEESLSSRIRTLFWIASTNFLLPVPLYVLQLILVIVDPSSSTLYVVSIVHNFVAILCAVMATFWSSTTSARSSLDSAMPPARSRLSEAELGTSRRNPTMSATVTTETKGTVDLDLGERKPAPSSTLPPVRSLQVKVEWSRDVTM